MCLAPAKHGCWLGVIVFAGIVWFFTGFNLVYALIICVWKIVAAVSPPHTAAIASFEAGAVVDLESMHGNNAQFGHAARLREIIIVSGGLEWVAYEQTHS